MLQQINLTNFHFWVVWNTGYLLSSSVKFFGFSSFMVMAFGVKCGQTVLWNVCAKFVYNNVCRSVWPRCFHVSKKLQTQNKNVSLMYIVDMTGFILLTGCDWQVRVKICCPTLFVHAATDFYQRQMQNYPMEGWNIFPFI